jgi:hypothetical protein
MRRARKSTFTELDDATRTRFVIEEDDQGDGGERMSESMQRLRGDVCMCVCMCVCVCMIRVMGASEGARVCRD